MSAPPAGDPRFVAAFYQPASGWTVAAESTAREPVDHAVAAMIQTVQSRGLAPVVELWGPSEDGGAWRHLETIHARAGRTVLQDALAEQPEPRRSAREERLRDRRHQVLTASLAANGLTELDPADDAAIAQIIDGVDEETVRRIAHWLSTVSNSA